MLDRVHRDGGDDFSEADMGRAALLHGHRASRPE